MDTDCTVPVTFNDQKQESMKPLKVILVLKNIMLEIGLMEVYMYHKYRLTKSRQKWGRIELEIHVFYNMFCVILNLNSVLVRLLEQGKNSFEFINS